MLTSAGRILRTYVGHHIGHCDFCHCVFALRWPDLCTSCLSTFVRGTETATFYTSLDLQHCDLVNCDINWDAALKLEDENYKKRSVCTHCRFVRIAAPLCRLTGCHGSKLSITRSPRPEASSLPHLFNCKRNHHLQTSSTCDWEDNSGNRKKKEFLFLCWIDFPQILICPWTEASPLQQVRWKSAC